ncbi:MAG: AGE family epimerase/isomerase [Clostridium sp.]|jgi:mannobiose 2-epimerase|nr:AGE family epimerase/isomerase [Clostridium sp.]
MERQTLHTEMKEHLTQVLLPFWKKWIDEENGGYYGYVDTRLRADKGAEKGCILNSRILWFFSSAYLALGEESLRKYADHAWRFLRDCCIDRERGGVFWSVDCKGRPLDTTKHTYNQAFAVYALSSYYKAFGEEQALRTAEGIFRLIETGCKDAYGYQEAQTRDFEPAGNDKLSENGVTADRTMNTLLHLLEAYTEFYRVSRSGEAAARIREILDRVAEKVYNPVLGRQEVFFDRDMNSLIDLHSYGHDIEAAWLIDRGTDVLGDEDCRRKMGPITLRLAQRVYEAAYDGQSVANECERGKVDQRRIWWVEAEAVVGFYNAWQRSPEKTYFREAAEAVWRFIRNHLAAPEEGSEWFWCTDRDGNPMRELPLVEPWKCPYHNGRMCMEIMKRTE